MEGIAYLIVGAVIALGIAGYVLWGVRLGQKPPAYPERRSVVVNFVDDPTQAIRGVLWESTHEHLILKGAEVLADKMAPVKIDGDAVIFRSRVGWLQVLPVSV